MTNSTLPSDTPENQESPNPITNASDIDRKRHELDRMIAKKSAIGNISGIVLALTAIAVMFLLGGALAGDDLGYVAAPYVLIGIPLTLVVLSIDSNYAKKTRALRIELGMQPDLPKTDQARNGAVETAKAPAPAKPQPILMTTCKACGKEVSSTAPACPSCGETFPGLRVSCPKCGSMSFRAGSKGFGLRGAAAGVLLLGPVGALGGFIGSKDFELTCLRCNHKWAPTKEQLST